MKTLFGAGALAVAAAMLAGCHGDESASPAAVQTVQAKVVESQQEQVPLTLKSTGTVHARETAVVSAQVMGRIQQVLVREGDNVRAGQTLAVLDDAALRASATQAKAGLKAAQDQEAAAESNAKLAESTLARYRQLEAQKSVSPQEMDEVTRRAEAANAQVDALRAQSSAMKAQLAGSRAMLGYSRIVAPYTGVVTARMVDPGALASPGVPLLQIDSAGPLQLQATVAESAIGFVHKGMKIAVSIDSAPGIDPAGTISEIVPAADTSTHSFTIKVDLPPSKALLAGMYATAEIPVETRQAVLVSQSAIVVRGSLSCAYVLDADNIAQLRYVTVGSSHGDQIEILSGIAANEKLVDGPADRDLAGRSIEVQP